MNINKNKCVQFGWFTMHELSKNVESKLYHITIQKLNKMKVDIRSMCGISVLRATQIKNNKYEY